MTTHSSFISNNGDKVKYVSERLSPLNKGDIAIVMSDVPNGKALVRCYLVDNNDKYTLNQRIGALKTSSKLFKNYLLIVLDRNKYLLSYDDGQKQTNLKKIQIISCPIPLPPLPEQQRIVAKVDELMALCDQLEQQQHNSQAAHQQLVSQLLNTLTQAANTNDFQHAWQRIATHFEVLFTTEDSINQLKQSILQLAVMGKLVAQNPNDEPASQLLKKIATEKAQLVKDGKIKAQKPLPPITEEEKPFDLPKGWEWVRLGELLSKIGAGSTPLGGRQVYSDNGIKFLRSQNVWDDGLRLSDVAFISPEIHEKMSGTQVCAGDILFNITGASIGRCALVSDDFDTANVSQHVTIIRVIDGSIKKYLHKLLISKLVQQTVMDVQVGVSREGLSIGKLGLFLMPLPPLPEQQRIVAKVDELMALCDQLKHQLNQAKHLQGKIADVLVAQALA